MKIKRTFLAIAALGLAVFLIPRVPACAETLLLGTAEIRDPMLNNAVAARVVLPQGWSIKEQEIMWTPVLYGDPAHAYYVLQGPADEVEFSAITRMKFNFDQSWLSMADFMHNETIRMANQQCQDAQRYASDFAPQLCAQISASAQQELQKIQQHKETLLSGKATENGMIIRQPMWAADVVQWLLRDNEEVTDFQIKKVERPADLTALLQKAAMEQDAQARRATAVFNMPFKGVTLDVARVHAGITKNGKRYDGIYLVVTQYWTVVNNQRWPVLSPQSGPDPLYGKEFVMWSAYINSATALAGRLQAYDAELTAIAANSGVDPVWQATVDKFAEDMSRQVAEAVRQKTLEKLQRDLEHQNKMQAMRNDTYNYVNRTRQEVFARRSESLSNAATGWTDVLTDRQRWQGGGTKYVAPNNYKYAWEGADDKVVFSNDSSFNPNHSSSFSGNWNEMRKVPW